MNQNDEYLRTSEEQIKEWKAQIDRIRARADQAEARQREQGYEKVNILQQKHKESEQKLQELKNADQGAWEALKEGYEKLRRDMEESIEEVKTTL